MVLYHFSENPGIERFVPHVAKTSNVQDEAFVWAIDDWHAPMYYTPRNCPRACFWAGDSTTAQDRERWFGFVAARFVMTIESAWLDRVRAAKLYRYQMPTTTFAPRDAQAGHHVSRTTVEPKAVEPVGDLLTAIAGAGVELRLTPRLGPVWRRVWRSTLHYSATRLRYAQGYPEEFE